MIKLPSGLEIKNLIDDLRIFSWEACETLLFYSQILKESNYKSNILENDNYDEELYDELVDNVTAQNDIMVLNYDSVHDKIHKENK